MNRISALIALPLSMSLSNAAPAATQSCKMSATFEQKDPNGARRVLYTSDALVFSTAMHVDADGGPHAYSTKDPDGTLCNPSPKHHPENTGMDPLVLGCAWTRSVMESISSCLTSARSTTEHAPSCRAPLKRSATQTGTRRRAMNSSRLASR
jgi:hypothetical protein